MTEAFLHPRQQASLHEDSSRSRKAKALRVDARTHATSRSEKPAKRLPKRWGVLQRPMAAALQKADLKAMALKVRAGCSLFALRLAEEQQVLVEGK